MGKGLSKTIVPGWNPGPSIVHVQRSLFTFVLALRVFLRVLQFFLLHRNQIFYIPISSGKQ